MDDAPAASPLLIRRRTAADPRVLSFAQQRLWFLDQMKSGTATYNIPFYCHICGPLNVEALHRAVQAIVDRHEVLRTVYASVKGRPIPVVAKNWSVEVRQIDFRHFAEAARGLEAQRLLREEALRPFNLRRDVMLRTMTVQLAEQEFLFLHVSHHIAWEYWSTSVWYQDLANYYEAFLAGRAPTLPELPIQYADYALWQRRWLQGDVLERLVSYWRRQLGGSPPLLNLPTDHPRPPLQSFRGAKIPLTLPAALLDAVKALSLQSGMTPFMTLLAAFKTFLSCCTGQQDMCVGSPIASRPRSETKGLIGFFANTVVLRTSLARHPTFRQLMGRVREVTLGAIANQALPFDKLVEALQPPRDSSRMPLFQVNFRVLKAPPVPLRLSGLRISPPEFIDSGTSKFDLALELVATPSASGYGSRGFWEYSSDLFEPATIHRMSADFEKLLGGLLAQPDTPLDDVAIVQDIRRRWRKWRKPAPAANP